VPYLSKFSTLPNFSKVSCTVYIYIYTYVYIYIYIHKYIYVTMQRFFGDPQRHLGTLIQKIQLTNLPNFSKISCTVSRLHTISRKLPFGEICPPAVRTISSLDIFSCSKFLESQLYCKLTIVHTHAHTHTTVQAAIQKIDYMCMYIYIYIYIRIYVYVNIHKLLV